MSTQDRIRLLKEILPVIIKKFNDELQATQAPSFKHSVLSGQLQLATEILYALKRGDFVNLLLTAGLPADYARKFEPDLLSDNSDSDTQENGSVAERKEP